MFWSENGFGMLWKTKHPRLLTSGSQHVAMHSLQAPFYGIFTQPKLQKIGSKNFPFRFLPDEVR